MKPRILILDSYYPEVICALPINPAGTYESELQKILYQSFGTFDAYSRNLRELGWEAFDVIANHEYLQGLWAADYGASAHVVRYQIEHYEPDVLFLQDLSVSFSPLRPKIIAAQVSCPWPGDDNIRKCDVIFTSFPHYIPRIEALGVKAVYNPLAFDPIVFDRVNGLQSMRGTFYAVPQPERIHDVVFIGGVGNPGHWRRGMETLNAVAEAIPTFKWWGYGADLLPYNSALRQKYQGEAWGLDMYRIMLQSKIVLNRHGEVAEGCSNNMRMFEATGCGALLVTEASHNINELFNGKERATYMMPNEAVEAIRWYLELDGHRGDMANNGQQRTLSDHTYAQRMKTVSDTLLEMLK